MSFLVTGVDVTAEVEFCTNTGGHVSALVHYQKYLKVNEKQNEVVNYRCRFYKSRCKARLVVGPSWPRAQIINVHNHQPEEKDMKEVYRNVVSIQKFCRSDDGSFGLTTIEFKEETL